MNIAVNFVAPIVLAIIFIANGFRLLLYTNSVAEKYAVEQERRGREGLARYERGLVNKVTLKFIGSVLIVAPSALIVAMVLHRFRQ